ncbi:hypothetical protein VRRI112168_10700 [Vreelandella rituensis]|uniref:hypothetical protein n=1 Tax=Vreelandella rituensis TaxID=2282306 RepID=UPI0015F03F26|nr:hypothetical protein [Halomonas rituensis]
MRGIVEPGEHVKLYEHGFRKRYGMLYGEGEETEVSAEVGELIARLQVHTENTQ